MKEGQFGMVIGPRFMVTTASNLKEDGPVQRLEGFVNERKSDELAIRRWLR